MNKTEVIEGNKLIAEFMGGVLTPTGNIMHVNINYWLFPNGDRCSEYDTKYHTSWDWLMPVVEKIGNLTIETQGQYPESIHYSINRVCTIFEVGDHTVHITDCGINPPSWTNAGKTAIYRTWQAVVQFIQWYNSNKKT